MPILSHLHLQVSGFKTHLGSQSTPRIGSHAGTFVDNACVYTRQFSWWQSRNIIPTVCRPISDIWLGSLARASVPISLPKATKSGEGRVSVHSGKWLMFGAVIPEESILVMGSWRDFQMSHTLKNELKLSGVLPRAGSWLSCPFIDGLVDYNLKENYSTFYTKDKSVLCRRLTVTMFIVSLKTLCLQIPQNT